MPKMKTKKGAAKRFKVKGNGALKRARAGMNHILTKMNTKRKRNLRGCSEVDSSDVKSVKRMLKQI